MTLRTATIDDLDAVIDLYVHGWQSSYADIVDANFLAAMNDNPRSRDYLTSLLSPARDDAVVLLDEYAGEIMGFIAAGHTRDTMDEKLAEIYAIYIDPKAQQQGLGQELFDAAVKALKQGAFTHLHVWTFAANTGAQKAYLRWGGAPSDTTRLVTVGGDNLEEVGFDWTL